MTNNETEPETPQQGMTDAALPAIVYRGGVHRRRPLLLQRSLDNVFEEIRERRVEVLKEKYGIDAGEA